MTAGAGSGHRLRVVARGPARRHSAPVVTSAPFITASRRRATLNCSAMPATSSCRSTGSIITSTATASPLSAWRTASAWGRHRPLCRGRFSGGDGEESVRHAGGDHRPLSGCGGPAGFEPDAGGGSDSGSASPVPASTGADAIGLGLADHAMGSRERVGAAGAPRRPRLVRRRPLRADRGAAHRFAGGPWSGIAPPVLLPHQARIDALLAGRSLQRGAGTPRGRRAG